MLQNIKKSDSRKGTPKNNIFLHRFGVGKCEVFQSTEPFQMLSISAFRWFSPNDDKIMISIKNNGKVASKVIPKSTFGSVGDTVLLRWMLIADWNLETNVRIRPAG